MARRQCRLRDLEASGTVTIDTVMPRVTGSLTFMTTDQDVGTIAVSGNFDIKRCF